MFCINIWYLLLYVLIIQNSISEESLYEMYCLGRLSRDEFTFFLDKYNNISCLNRVYFNFLNATFSFYIFSINQFKVIFLVYIIFFTKFICNLILYYKSSKNNLLADFKEWVNFLDSFYGDLLLVRINIDRTLLLFTLHVVALFTYIAMI